jgi:hypothetical protein
MARLDQAPLLLCEGIQATDAPPAGEPGPAAKKNVGRRGTRPVAHKNVGRRGTRPVAQKRRLRTTRTMALSFDIPVNARDPRAFAILAKTIYRELRAEGYSATELLELVASEVKDQREAPESARRAIARVIGS